MGYAMFASRKLALNNEIFNIQSQIKDISDERIDLMEAESAICDGNISADDLANLQGFSSDYATKVFNDYYQNAPISAGIDKTSTEYQRAYNDARESYKEQGYSNWGPFGCFNFLQKIVNKLRGKETTTLNEKMDEWSDSATDEQMEKIAKSYEKKLEAKENKLETKQKTLETKLTALQSELEAVEKQEGQAIQNATPKYSGVRQ